MSESRWMLVGFVIFVMWTILFWFVWVSVADGVDTAQCEVEPASPWAPQGYICPPMYGEGTASTWPGPGVARNDCVYPWADCPEIVIQSHQTGLTVRVTPTMWCMCWVGVTGPQGETARIADLDPSTLAALGLDPGQGLYGVTVWREGVYPVTGPADVGSTEVPSPSSLPPATDDGIGEPAPQALPDTAYQP